MFRSSYGNVEGGTLVTSVDSQNDDGPRRNLRGTAKAEDVDWSTVTAPDYTEPGLGRGPRGKVDLLSYLLLQTNRRKVSSHFGVLGDVRTEMRRPFVLVFLTWRYEIRIRYVGLISGFTFIRDADGPTPRGLCRSKLESDTPY